MREVVAEKPSGCSRAGFGPSPNYDCVTSTARMAGSDAKRCRRGARRAPLRMFGADTACC